MRVAAIQKRNRKHNQDYKLPLIRDLGMKYPTETSKRPQRYGIFKCSCGNEFEAISKNVTEKSGCGCKAGGVTHNLSKHILYDRYIGMIARCYDVNHKAYKNYGGRGIAVCNRWMMRIENFIEDMYPSYEDGLSLDRIDGDKGYDKENCRWATRELQARNTRLLSSRNTSGYRGIFWNTQKNKWTSKIGIDKKQKYLGSYDTQLEAAMAYDKYVIDNKLEHTINGVL
jgi:hypothetical protein